MDNNINYSNKLFCTFVIKDKTDEILEQLQRKYTILYDKIFILESPESDEYIFTYNIDTGNALNNPIDNTILLHRKKESNSLYTINALNNLIRKLNNGVLDTNYRINWNDYKNSILLTQGTDVRILNTSIKQIVHCK
jgi:hypothetical protein